MKKPKNLWLEEDTLKLLEDTAHEKRVSVSVLTAALIHGDVWMPRDHDWIKKYGLPVMPTPSAERGEETK